MKCLNCNKEFEEKTNKKFCCVTCKNRYTAKQQYLKIKDTPEYKAKRKIYFDKWRKKNRLHFNDLLREKNRIHRHKKYYEFKKLKLCVICGRVKETNLQRCEKCRIQDNTQKRKARRKQ